MQIPLFPLQTVLVPGIVLPLNVFEPRYRALVEHCLATGEPFGVVWIREGREVGPGRVTLATTGTLAEIREARRDPDGRFEILAAGTRRFALSAVETDREPYPVGHGEVLVELPGDTDRAARLARMMLRRLARYLRLAQPNGDEAAEPIDVRIELEMEVESVEGAESAVDSGADLAAGSTPGSGEVSLGFDEAAAAASGARGTFVIPDDPVVLSHLLAGIVQLELPRRQLLLEAPTAEARLVELGRTLDRELWLLGARLRLFTADRSPDPARRN